MSELVISKDNLPSTIEELINLVIVGKEQLVARNVYLQVIKKLNKIQKSLLDRQIDYLSTYGLTEEEIYERNYH